MRAHRASQSWTRTLVVVALVAVAAVNHARATTLVSLNPDLGSGGPQPATYTFGGGTPAFAAGPGSASSGDGNLPPASQSPPGLELKTPLTITDADGSNSFGRQANGDGSTTFYDTALALSGLVASDPATFTTVAPGVTFDFQTLGSGSFAIYQSQPGGFTPLIPQPPPPLLLGGTFTSAVISGIDGSTIGNTLSVTVTYTSGAIYNALVGHGGTTTGSATFSLALLPNLEGQSPVFAIDETEPNFLLPFSATGQGFFDTAKVPEPSTLVLAASGLVAVLASACLKRRGGRRSRG